MKKPKIQKRNVVNLLEFLQFIEEQHGLDSLEFLEYIRKSPVGIGFTLADVREYTKSDDGSDILNILEWTLTKYYGTQDILFYVSTEDAFAYGKDEEDE